MTRFLACFLVSKFRKRRRLVDPTSHQLSRDESDYATQSKGYKKLGAFLEKPINLVTVSEEVVDDDSEKKVSTFEEENSPNQEAGPKLAVDHTSKKKVKFDLKVSIFEEEKSPNEEVDPKLVERAEENESGETGETPKEVNFEVPVLSPLKPRNYRYENSTVSDENDGEKSAVEESSESLFSLSIDSRRRVSAAESDDKEVNSPIPSCKLHAREVEQNGLNRAGLGRSRFVYSVFGSDEQLGQLRAVEEKASTKFNHQEKENINAAGGLENNNSNNRPLATSNSIKPTNGSKVSRKGKNPVGQETAVDASLSSWLVESERTPVSNSSVGNTPSGDAKPPAASREDRPVLEELKMEKATKQSATRTRTLSQSHKPQAEQIVASDSSMSFETPRTRSINKEIERAKWRELWKDLSAQI